MPPRKIIVTSSKGGTGKTTIAANASHGLARKGKKVLVMDIDTQNQLCRFFGANGAAGIADCVLDNAPVESMIKEIRPRLMLLPAGERISRANHAIESKRLLIDLLAPIENDYDFVIIDAPPTWDLLVINALLYCNEVWVPVSTEPASYDGSCTFFNRFMGIKKANEAINIDFVIPTRADSRVAATEEVVADLRKKFGDKVCDPIRYSVKIMNSFRYGKTIFEYGLWSRGRSDMNRFVERVLKNDKK